MIINEKEFIEHYGPLGTNGPAIKNQVGLKKAIARTAVAKSGKLTEPSASKRRLLASVSVGMLGVQNILKNKKVSLKDLNFDL